MIEQVGPGGGGPAEVLRHFSLPDFSEALRRSDALLHRPDAAAQSASIWQTSIAVAMAGLDPGPIGAQDLTLIRLFTIEGKSGVEAGAALGSNKTTALLRMRELERRLAIGQPGDWSPVLETLLQAGRITQAQAGQAVEHLTGRGDIVPAEAWKGLLAQLDRYLPSADCERLRWFAACGSLGLRVAERNLLRAMARGDVKTSADPAYAGPNNQVMRQSMAAKLGGFNRNSSSDFTLPMVAAAAYLGVLPPDYERRRVAVSRMQTTAAATGHVLTAGQAGLLLDVAARVPASRIAEIHGSGLALMAMKLWTALDVPGKWDQGRNGAALIKRAKALGLLEAGRKAAVAGEGVAPAGLVDPRVGAHAPAAGHTAAPPSISLGSTPITAGEIAAAPSLRPDLLAPFKAWKVQNLTAAEWLSAGGQNLTMAKVRLTEALGSPDARGYLAIAARAALVGQLTASELLQAERWAAAGEVGLTRYDLPILDAVARSPTLAIARELSGVNRHDFGRRLLGIARALGLSSLYTGPDTPQQLLDAAFRVGLFREAKQVPASMLDTDVLLDLSREREEPAALFETADAERYSPQVQAALRDGQTAEGLDGVLVQAVRAGLLLNPAQAGLLLDLAQHRLLPEIHAAYGPSFDADVATLAAMLEVDPGRPDGRMLQSILDAVQDEGLLKARPWPDPGRAAAEYGRLMKERFDLGPDLLAALRTLAAGAGEGAGAGAGAGSGRDVELASRLCQTVPNTVLAPGVAAIRAWARENGIGAQALPAEVAAAVGFNPSPKELALLLQERPASRPPALPDSERQGTIQQLNAVSGLLQRLGLTEAGAGLVAALVPVILDAAQDRGVT